ncbi:MAG: prephenate dehydrogenase [Candidatus Altiarchaeota archaeon]|nr:prephenate dehydrogenase [Candidatus Altiarchaeota archaeon]
MDRIAAIIGGYGGMGRLFAGMFKEEGFKVRISGPTESKGLKAASELGVEYFRDNKKAVEGADVVVISVPINVTLDVIREVGPIIKDGALFMDDTSVKRKACAAMARHSGKKVDVIGTHPVFGPRVQGIEGQTFVLTPVRGEKWLAYLQGALAGRRAKVVVSTPEEHDRIMAVVQGLTHFAYISMGKTLQELGVDVKRSRQFSSPIYDLMLDMIGRIIGQDPHLYAEIQMGNPEVLKAHRAFIKTAGKLSAIVKKNDEDKFVRLVAESARHFGDVERAMGRSDKAIFSLVAELDRLNASVGKELALRHIYSGKVHLGVVKGVTPDEVTLDDNGKVYTLKLSNIRVMRTGERIRYKAERYGTVSRDFSVLLEDKADERLISELLWKANENILTISIKDVYKGERLGAGKKSVCFAIDIINHEPKKTENSISDFFEDIGGTLR